VTDKVSNEVSNEIPDEGDIDSAVQATSLFLPEVTASHASMPDATSSDDLVQGKEEKTEEAPISIPLFLPLVTR